MHKKYVWLLVPILSLSLFLTGCSFTKQGKFIDANQATNYDHQKTTMSLTTSGKSEEFSTIKALKATTYTDKKADLAQIDEEITLDGESDSTTVSAIADLKKGNVYIKADSLVKSFSSSLNLSASQESAFVGKYVESSDGLNSKLDNNELASIESILSDPAVQKKLGKELKTILKDSDTNKFKKSNDNISYTYTHKQLRQIFKIANNELKDHKGTKDNALSASSLASLNKKLDKATVTETINTKNNKIQYKIKYDGTTYRLKTNTVEANKKIIKPSKDKVISQSEFTTQLTKILTQNLSDTMQKYMEEYQNESSTDYSVS
ncbi:hypothetical protein [Paucilactobacillus kaifaensis]|uniref:hypothetical protein n=1 Tax=Paucilactobacillus kaifaensis TaxID=2559921 RepID=UPI0010F45F87|nr:hypothetical protein [Paucilactobacillus kaifaensis]